jgi:hypothetical protein
MVEYSGDTIAVGVIACILWPFSLFCTVFSSCLLHRHRREVRLKHAGGGASSSGGGAAAKGFPMWLRCCFLLAAVFAMCCLTCVAALQWLPVEEGINIDALHRTLITEFDAYSRWCSILIKFTVGTFAMTKLFAYLFFFIKQRTVRPFAAVMSRLEKLVLLMSGGLIPFGIMAVILAQGDQNGLDSTCQLYLPIELLIVMLLADSTLSFLYLYLFVQPLRETMRANGEARRMKEEKAGGKATTIASGARVSDLSSLTTSRPPAASGHTNALELLMKKNTYACVAAVSASAFAMSFMLAAHRSNDQHTRKWVSVIGGTDALVTVLSLVYVMHKPTASNTAAGAQHANGSTLSAPTSPLPGASVASPHLSTTGTAPSLKFPRITAGGMGSTTCNRLTPPMTPLQTTSPLVQRDSVSAATLLPVLPELTAPPLSSPPDDELERS